MALHLDEQCFNVPKTIAKVQNEWMPYLMS
jgi:hypothetical protein